jgi:acetoin utilization deacetylase AcuC-like enzyme
LKYIFRSECLQHQTGNHPERAERLYSFRNLPNTEIPEAAEYLRLVHHGDYIQKVKTACEHSIPMDGDTLTSPLSFEAACAAVGASVKAAETNGFALIRPPGHHAYPGRASGFCLFNNIAIATRYLSQQGKKIMILDIDGHLGDGTSAVFYNDPKVLFCSLHQFPAFPGNGWIDEIGSGPGKGYTVNLPLPPGSADDIFWQGMNFLQPIAQAFNPDVVAVSAGFDAHHSDPLLQLNLSLSCFYKCGTWLSSQFENVFAVLEGGYNLESLPKAIHQFYHGMNQLKEPHPEATSSSDISTQSIFDQNLQGLQENLRDHWPI